MLKRFLFSLAVIGSLFSTLGAAWAEDLCVDPAGSGPGIYTTLQAALDAAAINVSDDRVMVVQGTYNGNFTYTSGSGNNITLEGGYTADCSTRQLDPFNTVLDGGSNGTVLYIDETAGGHIIIDGFTVRNGNTTGSGGGIYARSSSPTAAGNVTLSNSIITANTTAGDGGGVYAGSICPSTGTAGTVTLSNNIVSHNITTTQYAGGGGIYARSESQSGTVGAVILSNNTVVNNTTATDANGGGAFASSYSPQGGIPGTVTLTNNTIYNNTATNEGGGVNAYASSNGVAGGTLNCYNNIIRGNTSPTGADISLSVSGDKYGYNNNYSTMAGTWNGGSANNIDADPLFVNPGFEDYHLQPASPCIDAGENLAPQLPSTDFEGDPRVLDGDNNGTATVDMGVDEAVNPGSSFSWPMYLPAITNK